MKTLRMMTDEELVVLYAEGNNAAFDVLLNRYKSSIHSYIYFIVHNKDLTEDIFQETFVKVIMTIKQGRYTENGKFKAWITRIAHNLIIDNFRQERSENTVSNEIPPVRDKKYDFYGNLFTNLWDEAEKQLIEADKIFVIGYSFPKTDLRSSELFKKAFSSRITMPEVIIVNPAPELIEERFVYDLGITTDKLITIKDYFDSKIIKNVIVNKMK